MHSNRSKFFLVIVSIFLFLAFSLFPLQNSAKLSVKSEVSSHSVFYGDFITNTIIVRQDEAGFPSYPGDPNHYGLRLVKSDCLERMVISKKGLQKEYVIKYIYQPKFIGRVALNKITISVVSPAGVTNSMYTAKKVITIKRKEDFPFIGWIIIILLAVVLVGWGSHLIFMKRKLQN